MTAQRYGDFVPRAISEIEALIADVTDGIENIDIQLCTRSDGSEAARIWREKTEKARVWLVKRRRELTTAKRVEEEKNRRAKERAREELVLARSEVDADDDYIWLRIRKNTYAEE